MVMLKVLVVEDIPYWQKILHDKTKAAIARMHDVTAEIEVVETFEAAYERLNQGRWDLLITDIGLGNSSISPQKLGIQLIELAQEYQVQAIAVSGTPHLTPQNVRDLLMESGAADFFTKLPFDGSKFISRVQLLLQSQMTAEGTRKVHSTDFVSFKVQQLETRQAQLQSEWNVRSEKLAQLRKAFAIEAAPSAKFQLEKQIQLEQKELESLESQLAEVEQALKNENISTLSQRYPGTVIV